MEALRFMEQSCDFPLLRRLANYCILDTFVTHIRLWPQQDSRHPSIMVEVRKQNQHAHPQSRCCVWFLECFHPRQYQVNIPVSLQEEVLMRITARETVDIDLDQLDGHHDHKVFFNEILRRLKLLEVSHIH